MVLWTALLTLVTAIYEEDLGAVCETEDKYWLVLSNQAENSLQFKFQQAAFDSRTSNLHYGIGDISRLPCILSVSDPVALLYKGKSVPYTWELDYVGFLELGQKLSNPAMYTLQKQATFMNFQRYPSSFMLWYYPETSDPEHLRKVQVVEEVALKYHPFPVYFAKAFDVEMRKKEDIQFQDLPILKRSGTDQAFDFNLTDLTPPSVLSFIETYKWGLMPYLNTSLWTQIHLDCKEKILILIFVHESNYTHRSEWVYNMKIAQWNKWKGKDFRWQMAAVDVETMQELGNRYEIDQVPAILAVDQRNNTLKLGYGYFYPGEKTEVERFLQAAAAGRRLARKADFSRKPATLSTFFPSISLVEAGILSIFVFAVVFYCLPRGHSKRKLG